MPSSSRALYEAAQKRAAKVQQKQGRDLTVDELAELIRMEPDRGVTNVRNTDSLPWRRWLDRRFRCVVPFTSFAEFDNTLGLGPDGNTWSPSMPTARWPFSPASWHYSGPAFAKCAMAW